MSTAIRPAKPQPGSPPSNGELAPLRNGERLDQKTFHERYEAMPENVHAELIGGIVYMSSPVRIEHGEHNAELVHLATEYKHSTNGVGVFEGASVILADDSEPEPDAGLFLRAPKGGRTRIENGYLVGAPEWLAETSFSTESFDLNQKKSDYEAAGVKEYVVVALRQRKVHYFIARNGKFEELLPGADGIFRSEAFPGLWIDPGALLNADGPRLSAVLRQGLASPEHREFVRKLASA